MPIPPTTTDPGVNRRLLQDQVFDVLFAAISDGILEPGEHLEDADLGSWLNVSRTPIRQALGRLAEMGLVEMVPNRYTRVAIPNPELFLEGLEVASALWHLAVQKTMLSLTDEDIAQFTELTQEAIDMTEPESVTAEQGAELIGLILSITDFFVIRSGNEVLDQTVRLIEPRVAHVARAGSSQFDLPRARAVFEDLRTGVQERDGQQVASAFDRLSHEVAQELAERMLQARARAL